MPFYSARNLCPNCAKPIRTEVLACGYCGAVFESQTASQRSPLPDGVARHRGGRILALAAVSLLLFLLAWVGFSCAGFLQFALPSALPYLGCGLSALVLGQSFAIIGLVFAFQDWFGMKVGRVDPNGRGRTVFGGFLAGVSVLMYWGMIGAIMYGLF